MLLDFVVRGIKCDACDYKDNTVRFEDYEQWVNRPCPKCGANLLTQADYELTKKMAAEAKAEISETPAWLRALALLFTPTFRIRAKLNGTGKVTWVNPEEGNDEL